MHITKYDDNQAFCNLILLAGAELPENCLERHPTFCFGHCQWDYHNRNCMHKNPKVDEINDNSKKTSGE